MPDIGRILSIIVYCSMRKKYSINVGDRYNNLIVEKIGIKNKHNQSFLICRCSCGNEVSCMPHNLITGKTKSCGCLKQEKLKIYNTKYYVGSKIGMLTILKEYDTRDPNGKRMFQVQCDCGIVKDISIHYGMKSCGCLKRISKIPEKDLFTRYRRNSIKKNKQFNLSIDQFKGLIYSNCHYCGSSPDSKLRVINSDLHLGIDRIDSNNGYTMDNCVSCCSNCNYAKRTLSYKEFMLLIKSIYEKHNLQLINQE